MSEVSSTPAEVPVAPAPISQAERIGSLDLLRGIAVLGILIVNIQSFSMPDPAYLNPTVWGDFTGINKVVWAVSHVFAEFKFMSLFSLMFGAGIVLMCSRLEQRGLRPARTHYRRILFLFIFGLMHAYLLWVGDILVWYSLSGVLAYLFWRMRPGWLAFWALLFLGVGTALYALFQWSLPYWPEEARQGNAVWWSPPPEVIQHRLDTYRSGWLTQMSERIPTAAALHTFVYVIYALWRTLGMMLAGMALIKWGILSAERSRGFYVRTAIVALVVGLPITAWGAWQNYTHGWSMDYSQFGGHLFNYWGSVAVTLGYIALIMLWHHSCSLSGLKSTLANVGRMAFSCYILQTVICTTLFFGHGFALYGRVPRWGQMLIVLAVWAVVIAFANWWLARFRYGPLEWLWRSLTYGRKQPFSLTS
jgi:uncharacterized protein